MKDDSKLITRILDNERFKEEALKVNSFLIAQIDDCKSYSLSPLECRQLGVERGGLISSIIAHYVALQEKRKDELL